MNDLLAAHGLLLDEFLWPLVAVVIAGLILPVASVHLVARRVPFLALALPEGAFAGMAAGLWLFPYWVAARGAGGADGALEEPGRVFLLTAAVAGTALVLVTLAVCGRGAGARQAGAHAAIIYVVCVALGEIFRTLSPFGDERLHQLVHGELLGATKPAVLTLAAVTVPLGVMLMAATRRMLFVAAEPRVAGGLGVRPARWTAVFYVLLGLLIAATVTTIGPLTVFTFLLVPAVVLRPGVGSVRRLTAMAAAVGAMGAYVGAWTSVAAGWPMAASVATATTAVALIAVGLSRLATR